MDLLRLGLKKSDVKTMNRKLLIMLLLMVWVVASPAQTIRNSNNSAVARIDNDGTVRNSNNSVVARIDSKGDIRDSNNHLLGKSESNVSHQ